MSFYLLPNDLAALRTTFSNHAAVSAITVICYCAEWCDTCRQYLNDFQHLSAQWPEHTFIWVDIEENPEFLEDEDVENFPTILIQDKNKNRFFGPMLPHIGHLDTLLRKANGLPVVSAVPGPVSTLINSA